MLTPWLQDSPCAVRLARSVTHQDGFEVWRLLWRESHPQQAVGGAVLWPLNSRQRRQFCSPGMGKRRASIRRRRGGRPGISEEDQRALLVTESTRQNLATHAATLTTHQQVRAVVVSYLQAKRVWTPAGSYAGPPKQFQRDRDAMDIGKEL